MSINDGWHSYVQKNHAIPLYERFWGGCEVIENDTKAKEEDVARLLDYGDVDKIVVVDGVQKHLAQRFRKPYGDDEEDADFTLRYYRPSRGHNVEYQRLMKAHGDEHCSYPPLYSFGRVHPDHTQGLYELYIIKTDQLISAIKNGRISEDDPIKTGEGQKFMAYDVEEIRQVGAIKMRWFEKPNDPERITSWAQRSGASD